MSNPLRTLKRRLTWNTTSGLGIDIGQSQTKIVWMAGRADRSLRSMAVSIPTRIERVALAEASAQETTQPDGDRRTDHNPFKQRRSLATPSAKAWTSSELRNLCARIASVLEACPSRRAEVSVVLSMAVCDYRSVYVTKEADRSDVLQSALQQSIGDDGPRCWANLVDSEAKPKQRIFSVPESLSWLVGESLESVGMSPRRIDGLPWCMARAYQHTEPKPDEAGLMVDWSFGDPTLVAVVDGQPAYVRRLNHGGLQKIASQARQDLHLNADEAARWIQQCEQPAPGCEAISETRSWMRHCCQRMALEIQAAIDYVRWRNKDRAPSKLWLVGGGAMHASLTEMLDAELAIDVRAWRRSWSSGHLSANYATAASLAELGVSNAK